MSRFTECLKPRRRPEGPVLVVIDAYDARSVIERQPFWATLAAQTPEKRIQLAIRTESKAMPLLGADPALSQLHILPTRTGWFAKGQRRKDLGRLCKRLKPRALFVVSEDEHLSLAGGFWNGVPERRALGLGLKRHERWLSKGPRLGAMARRLSPLEQNTAFFELYGIRPERVRPQLYIRPEIQKDLWARLMGELKAPARPWLVLGTCEHQGEQGLSHRVCAALNGAFRTLFWVGPGPMPEGLAEALRGKAQSHDPKGARAMGRLPHAHVIDASSLDAPERLALYDLCDLILAPESQRLAEAAAVGARAYGFYDADTLPRTPGLTPLHAKGSLYDMTPDETLALVLAHYPGARPLPAAVRFQTAQAG